MFVLCECVYRLQKDLHAIQPEQTDVPYLTDLAGRSELYIARPFVEVIAQGYTVIVCLNLPFGSPERDAYRVMAVKYLFCGGDVYAVHLSK